MIHKYTILLLCITYVIKPMGHEYKNKEYDLQLFTQKIALMHYHNNRFDASFSHARFSNCVSFSTIIRVIKLYNKALTANQPECRLCNSHELQYLFNPDRWIINDQIALYCAYRSPDFFKELICNLSVVQTKFPIPSSDPPNSLLQEMCKFSRELIMKASHDKQLQEQLLQEYNKIIFEYKKRMAIQLTQETSNTQ